MTAKTKIIVCNLKSLFLVNSFEKKKKTFLLNKCNRHTSGFLYFQNPYVYLSMNKQ